MATINDLVLVHVDGNPAFFARIEEISPDVKPGWWHVTLLVLGIPLQLYHWILDTSQIDGEPFTMGGIPIRLERVVSPYRPEPASTDESSTDDSATDQPSPEDSPPPSRPGTVISLDEIRKKR